MRKLFLILAIAFAGVSVNAQNFNVGLSGGLPSGDASDLYTFSILLDANYLWEVSEEFNVGAATGYIYSLGDSIGSFDVEDAGFIPLAAAGRYNITEEFVLGADIGYALTVQPSDSDGGFYYAPKAQYAFTESLSAVLAYRGVSRDNTSFDIISLGVEFKL